MKLRIIPSLLAVIGFFSLTASAQTPTPTPSPTPTPTPPPVLVYDLELDKTGPSVNYTFFKDGFLVASPQTSSFSTVVVLTDPNTFNFYQAGDFVTGSYNEVRDYAGRRHVVLFGATTSSSDNTALQVIGTIDRRGGVGGGKRADYSDKMRGFLMASGAEINSSGNSTTQFQFGYAGFSKATAEFNKGLTKDVNRQGFSVSQAVGYLEKYLSNRGIPGANGTPSPTPGPSPTPTPTPTPSPTASPSQIPNS